MSALGLRRLSEELSCLKFELDALKREYGDALNYKKAVEALELGVAVSDPTLPGNPLVTCNDSLLKRTGYKKEEVVGNLFT